MRSLLFLISIGVFAVVGMSQQKSPQPQPVRPPFPDSLQVVVVTTADASAIKGKAQLFERKTRTSKWKASGESFPVVVGRSGLAWSTDSAPEGVTELKKEGDGRAPAGLFPLTFAFGSVERPDGIKLSYSKLEEFSECVDDPASGHYNKLVDRMKVGNFDWKSSEKMLEVGAEYELGVFVAHNSYPARKGDGSCIFLHLWKDAETGTSGCTAMARENLERILNWADPARVPYLAQMNEADYAKYRKGWNLPKLK